MTDANRYAVRVRPARPGYLASVSKKTLLEVPGLDSWWMGWSPEPQYWRPTEAWAVRRALRKKTKLERADARRNATRVVTS